MALSMIDSEIAKDYLALNVTIVGAPGLGKTTLASKIGEPGTVYFATTEMGYKYLKIRNTDVWQWSDFAGIVKDLTTTKHPYKHLVIDIFDKLVDMAEDEICLRNKVTMISQIPFGSGYKAMRYLIMDAVDLLNKHNIGVTFVCHDKIKEVKTENVTYTAVGSSLSDSVERVVFGASDLVLFCYKDKDKKHMIRTRPTKHIICAKDRSGRLDETFAMDAKILMDKLRA
jgi:hypothetical protein